MEEEIGIWNRKVALTKEQLKRRQELFTEYQKEYNITHNPKIFWNKLLPLVKDAVKSQMITVNKSSFVKDYEDKVEEATLLLAKRYITKPDYKFEKLAGLAYWACIYVSRIQSTIIWDRTLSYDSLLEMDEHEEHFNEIEENSKEFEEINKDNNTAEETKKAFEYKIAYKRSNGKCKRVFTAKEI